ncbi:MAG: PadR family transcriptional regulator [Verrucomicrobiia bacterium]
MKTPNPNFLNGVPELLLLQLLSRREMYGYELVKEIQSCTGGQLAFGEGCVYPILHSLEAERLLNSERREVAGRSRSYYRLTNNGHKRLAELNTDWTRVARAVNRVLGGQYA